jgi:hypothetical protein
VRTTAKLTAASLRKQVVGQRPTTTPTNNYAKNKLSDQRLLGVKFFVGTNIRSRWSPDQRARNSKINSYKFTKTSCWSATNNND